ncbi:MAG: hypothetical protein WA441_13110 [Methyloceanibacter sp.]
MLNPLILVNDKLDRGSQAAAFTGEASCRAPDETLAKGTTEMKYLGLIGALLISLGLGPLAVAQGEAYVPSLGDIMGATQLRHVKLWFAGKLRNWELAAYEVGQIKASLEDAAQLYRGIPVTDVTLTAEPVQLIGDAIEAKDSAKFAKAFNDLTSACNACHQAIGRGFIVIQVPTASPFSDQAFSPRTKK